MNKFDGFQIQAQCIEGEWQAHFIKLPHISAREDTYGEALNELQIAWETMKESYRKRGDEIPISDEVRCYDENDFLQEKTDIFLNENILTEAMHERRKKLLPLRR